MKVASTLFRLFIITSFLSGCQFFQQKQEDGKGEVIARVYDNVLYLGQVSGLNERGLSHADSVALINSYINEWTKRELLVVKAKSVINPESDEIAEKIERYKEDIVIEEYLSTFAGQQLDTLVSETEIKEFYKNYAHHFVLHENIVRARLIVIPEKGKEKELIRALITADLPEAMKELVSLCSKNASSFFLKDSVWTNFQGLIANTPFEKMDLNQIKDKRGLIELREGNYIYLLRILDFKGNSEIAPLSYVKEDVKEKILYIQKVELIKKLELDLLKKAKEEKQIETYSIK